MTTPKPTIYAVDAHALLHRSYHALPSLTTSSGEEVGALYGFSKFILRLLRDKKPEYIAVCFDSPAKTFRHDIYKEYKANREKTDDALVMQLKAAHDIIKGLGLEVLALKGFEADDLIACVARIAGENNLNAILVTSDKDSYQLVNSNVSVWSGSEKDPLRQEKYVVDRYGVLPSQMVDYQAIVGDSADNIPGVKGVGPKTAAMLLNKFNSLEGIYEALDKGDSIFTASLAKKMREGKEDAFIARKLTQLNSSCENINLNSLKAHVADEDALMALFKRFEFKDLISLAKGKQNTDVKLADSSDWDEVMEKLYNTSTISLHADEEKVLVGLSQEEYAQKNLEDLTSNDRKILESFLCGNAKTVYSHDIKTVLHKINVSIGPQCLKQCKDSLILAYCDNSSAGMYDFIKLCAVYIGQMIPESKEKNLCIENIFIRELCQALEDKLKSEGRLSLYSGMEMPLINVIYNMEKRGMKINREILLKLQKELADTEEKLQKQIEEKAGCPINVNSPKQLSKLFFEDMGLKPVRKTKTGFSTDEDVLVKLAQEHDIAKDILEFRETVKLKSTYVDNLLNGADKFDCVHTVFNQVGTATGRLSSSNPNLQNIPQRSERGLIVRKSFIAEKGCKLLAADYSQIDLRILAHESGDKRLIEAFKHGGDIHTQTASEVFGVMPGMVTKEMRGRAKAINFGIVYGQGAMGLAGQLGISHGEAKKYIDHYFEVYSGVRKWIDETVAKAKKDGYVKTFCNRVRHIPELSSPLGYLASAGQRMAVNTVVQGGSADVIKIAMIYLYQELNNTGAYMISQVHDEIILQVPTEKLKQVSAAVKDKMENTVKLSLPLVVDIKVGDNWAELDKIEV